MDWNTLPTCGISEKTAFNRKYKYSNVITPYRINLKKYNNLLIELSRSYTEDYFGVVIERIINSDKEKIKLKRVTSFSRNKINYCIDKINEIIKENQ